MPRKFLLLLSAFSLMLAQGCMKRLPAVAGGDKKVVAGHEMTFGSPGKIPEGGSVVWSMGDGSRYTGARIRHAWQRPGKFQVVVTVTDPDGQKRRDSATVDVSRPALLDVIPSTADFVLLLNTPGEKLKNVPLLLEHVFSSSAAVNSTLAKVRELLGFDPFDPDGWRDAGLDPTGGVAYAGLNGGRNVVIVAALLPGDKARQTMQQFLLRDERMKEKPANGASFVTVVGKDDLKDPQFAYMNFRGHVWLAFADKQQGTKPGTPGKGPLQVLSQLRQAGLVPGMSDNKDWFADAVASRRAVGAVELYMSGEFVRLTGKEGVSNPEVRAKDVRIIDKLRFVRMDLDLLSDAVKADVRLGFMGKQAARLESVMRARNDVPDFRTTMATGVHMAMKWSLDLAGFLQALADISGGKQQWDQTQVAMGQFKETSGVDIKADILDNLGDSVMATGRLNLVGIFGLAGQGLKKKAVADYLDASMLIQLREPKRFFAAVEALSHVDGLGVGISPMESQGHRTWSIGPKELGLVLMQAHNMAVVATSEVGAVACAARLDKPHEPDVRWPQYMDAPNQQVLGVDLSQLRKDVESFEPSSENASGLMIKNVIMMTLAGVGNLDMLVANATFQNNVLVISGSLTMK